MLPTDRHLNHLYFGTNSIDRDTSGNEVFAPMFYQTLPRFFAKTYLVGSSVVKLVSNWGLVFSFLDHCELIDVFAFGHT